MNKELTRWIWELVNKLENPTIVIPKEDVVGYIYNHKKKVLKFLSQKEADRFTKKGLAWKRLGEDWFGEETKKSD